MLVPRYLSRLQVPTYYPVCQRIVDQWIADEVLPIIRIGAKPVFRAADIEEYLDSLLVKPARGPGRPRKDGSPVRRRNPLQSSQAQ